MLKELRVVTLCYPCADSENSFRRKFDNVFLVDEGTQQIPLKVDHHRHASETPFSMAFRWRVNDGPTLNAGLVAAFVIFLWIRTRIAKKPYNVCDLSVGRGRFRPPVPLLTRACLPLVVYISSRDEAKVAVFKF